MEINYSFIIPHKNCPDLLNRCLDSIPQREDIQIIVVDDNSDDGKKPSVKRKNVEVVLLDAEHSKGAGRARNVGLERAKGKYIIFSDSDDFFESSFWGQIDPIMEKNTADIVYFKDRAVDSDTLEPIGTRNRNNKYIDDIIQNKVGAEDQIRFFHIVPWGKVFRGDFLRKSKVQYDEVMASNDVMFSTKTGHLANSVSVSCQIMYVVTRRQGSLVNTKSKESLRCRYEVALRQNKYVKSIGKSRYSFNVITPILYSARWGACEIIWYFLMLIKYRVNPFSFLTRLVTS